jgi:hypothetical protein
MAIPNLQVPTSLSTANGVRQPILEGYVFSSGIHEPEISSLLSYKYPQYYLTSLLDRLGYEEDTAQKVFSWFEQDRTRRGGTVVELAGAINGNPTAVVNTDIIYSATAPGYFIVNDTVRFESGIVCRVTATQIINTDKQQITVVKMDGSNFVTADIAANDKFGHIASAFGEYSDAPAGRLFTPEEKYNTTTIIRRSMGISGDEFTNKTRIGDGKAWYFEAENQLMKEFAKDKETTILFGQIGTGAVKSTRGLLDFINQSGVVNGFAASAGVDEEDIQDHIKDLLIQGTSNEITVLAGAQFLADFQRAMRDYTVGGASGMQKLAGLDFQQYKFMGKTLTIAYYELFDDPTVVPSPANGLNSTGRADFSNFSLWLDMGKDENGTPLIVLRHKAHGGISRKWIHAIEKGLVSPSGVGGEVANGKDGFTVHYLCEVGLQCKLAHRHGILRATS